MSTHRSRIPALIEKYEADLLTDWMKEQLSTLTRRPDLISERDLKEESTTFLNLLKRAVRSGDGMDIHQEDFSELRDMLARLSRSRALQGFTPSETATFVLSFKQPLFRRIFKEFEGSTSSLAEETWSASELIDRLGLFTTESFLRSREEVIRRQQEEMLELSTPVVKLWEGILALPMIGTLDSNRTQIVMESLLQKIVETGSEIAIIDITGVPTVDTLVAQHLLKTVTAARLMGAECIISGIRPQIAATIVHLGVELGDVTTKSTLADAFGLALQRVGKAIGRAAPTPAARFQIPVAARI